MSDPTPLPSSFAAFYLAEVARATSRRAEAMEHTAMYAAAIHGVDNVLRVDFPCGHSAFVERAHNLDAHPHHCPLCRRSSRSPGCDLVYYLPDL